jgi:Domain of unknown function (DUF4352)
METKHRNPKKPALYLMLFIGVLALTSFACTSSSNIDTGSTSNNDQTTTTSTPAVTAKTYKQSEVVEIDGVKVSISEVKDYKSSNQFIKAKDGNKFLAISVNIENTSGEGKSYNVFDYKLKDKEGASYQTGFADITPALSSGDLQPTKKAKGYVVFEVPTTIKNSDLEFMYEPLSFTGSKQVIWELQ